VVGRGTRLALSSQCIACCTVSSLLTQWLRSHLLLKLLGFCPGGFCPDARTIRRGNKKFPENRWALDTNCQVLGQETKRIAEWNRRFEQEQQAKIEEEKQKLRFRFRFSIDRCLAPTTDTTFYTLAIRGRSPFRPWQAGRLSLSANSQRRSLVRAIVGHASP
jgi:hypothetical protein